MSVKEVETLQNTPGAVKLRTQGSSEPLESSLSLSSQSLVDMAYWWDHQEITSLFSRKYGVKLHRIFQSQVSVSY